MSVGFERIALEQEPPTEGLVLSPVQMRERAEREMIRRILSKSRAELEAACRALNVEVVGRNDEALRAALFQQSRGMPPPSRLLQ